MSFCRPAPPGPGGRAACRITSTGRHTLWLARGIEAPWPLAGALRHPRWTAPPDRARAAEIARLLHPPWVAEHIREREACGRRPEIAPGDVTSASPTSSRGREKPSEEEPRRADSPRGPATLGYRAPAWQFSPTTLDLVPRGIRYSQHDGSPSAVPASAVNGALGRSPIVGARARRTSLFTVHRAMQRRARLADGSPN